MEIIFLCVGKTAQSYVSDGIAMYEKRLANYIKFKIELIPELKNNKNMSAAQQKEQEGLLLLRHIERADEAVLLDERGAQYSSVEFSSFLQKKMNRGIKSLLFIVGGPYGFSDEVYARVPLRLSLSTMTFSHQMVRLFFIEQLYRAFTILKGEPYHNE